MGCIVSNVSSGPLTIYSWVSEEPPTGSLCKHTCTLFISRKRVPVEELLVELKPFPRLGGGVMG